MIHKITVDGQFPNLNDYLQAERVNIRGRHGGFTTRGNELKQRCQNMIMPQIVTQLGKTKIKEPVVLHYHFFEPNKKRDLDNIASFFMKVFQDSMIKIHALSNDGWANIKGFTCDFDTDKEHPRIVIEVEEV